MMAAVEEAARPGRVAPLAALVAMALFGALVLGWRMWLQRRWTGDSGLRWPRSGAERLASVALVLGVLAAVLAPLADLLTGARRLPVLDAPWARSLAVAAVAAGGMLTVRSQLDMGAAWRIGLDRGERTALVTRGAFRFVRNPIYSGVVLAFLGFGLLAPNAFALTSVALLVLGVELQVRRVEEPHLLRLHGEPYRRYAARVGRFVPRMGRRLGTLR